MDNPKEGDSIAVWFSSGAASAVAAKKTIELYGNKCNIRIINNPIKEEDKDNYRFLKDVEVWLDYPIEFAINPDWPNCSAVEVWGKRRFMSSPQGAPCTQQLKKIARQKWEMDNPTDWTVLGFVYGEENRHNDMKHGRISKKTGEILPPEIPELLPILIDLKISKVDCYMIIKEAGIKLPEIYSMGYPNANCIGCVKASSISYWNHVRKVHPEIFKQRSEQSRDIGCKLVKYKGKRIYLDELDPNASGNQMKNMDFECGLFCQEDE